MQKPEPRFTWIVCSLLLTVSLAAAQEEATTTGEQPIDVDLVERTERRLVQLDVSIRPKKKHAGEPVPDLAVTDLELVVGGRPTEIRYADRVCGAEPVRAAEVRQEAVTAPAAEPAARPAIQATYLFYFEHKHLTMGGQNTALEMAEQLIPRLVANGNRGMVVSSGRRLLQSELTENADELLEMIQAVRKDPGQWSEYQYAELESSRIAEIQRANSQARALSLARQYQRDERAITNNRLRRLAATLGGLADLDPPKAVFYFADTVRANAGEHYAKLFGASAAEDPVISAMEMDSFSAALAMDRVTEEAGAQGARLYTVQAQGLQTSALGVQGRGRTPTNRLRDAENTLGSLALETGGETFRGGVDRMTISKIVDRIDEDLGCFYLLSFLKGNLSENDSLAVRVRFNQDSEKARALEERFEIRTRGQLVIQSESRRRESILLAAHAAGSAVESQPGRGVVIPLGYDGKRYQAMVQLMVVNPGLPEDLARGIAWDLGMSHVVGEKVEKAVSARIEVGSSRTPVVLETEWEFEPGSSEIVSVAYENRFGQLVTVKLDPQWPDPDHHRAVVSPIAVVQPASGVFLRKERDGTEQSRDSGTLGLGQGLAQIDRPAALVSLICRGRRMKNDLWIDRELVGQVPVDFELQRWEFDGQRCVQIRDLIREGAMSWGEFEYRVRVYDDAELEREPIAEASRSFAAIDPDAPIESAGVEDRGRPAQPL